MDVLVRSELAACSLHVSQSEISISQTTKVTSSEAPDFAALSQDNIPLSEMDKAAVLTLIREEVRHTQPETALV